MSDAGAAAAMARRLDGVERRLRALAGAAAPAGLTEADPPTGERWDAGQVWAHLAEICPYWVAQVDHLVGVAEGATGVGTGAVPFGRTKRDPDRVAAIEQGRLRSVAEQWPRVEQGIALTRTLLRRLDEDALRHVQGRHETLGVMPLERILDEFLVGHLEQHADQLEGLAAH